MNRYLTILFVLLHACGTAFCQQRHFTITDGLPNNQVRQIVELPNGQMLVVNEGAFSLYDGERFQPVGFVPDSVRHLASFGCYDYLWIDSSIVVLKDYYCLYIFDASRMQFRYDYGRFVGKDKVRRFAANSRRTKAWTCIDRQGGTWMPTETGGIFYTSPRGVKAKVVAASPETAGDHIRHMVPVGENIMLAANIGGVYLFDALDDSFVGSLAKGRIFCANINKGDDGAVWISTELGLYRYADSELRLYDHSNTVGFLHDHMRFAHPVDKRRVLVCNLMHSLGYLYLADNRFVLLNSSLQELDRYRTMIDACPLGDGRRMLVATQNGIFILNTATDKIEHPDYLKAMSRYSNKFNCLLVDRQKRVWVGAQNGLFVLVPQHSPTGNSVNYAMRYLSRKDGLSNVCIKALAEDDEGNVFVGTAYGLNKITIGADKMLVTSYGTSDGIPESEICERGMCIIPGRGLYFSTDDELIHFDTRETRNGDESLDVRLVGVMVNDSVWAPSGELKLAYNQNDIVLRLSALNYANASHTRYRYRLAGFHDTWIEQNDGRDMVEAKFHSLPPGTYTFCIQAAVDHASWGPEYSLAITVSPQWWQTWWAVVVYIVILLTVLARLLHAYLRHRERQLEAENEEKVNKLFELQSKARHQFAQQANVTTEHLADKPGLTLLARINKAIADNMDNVDYTVDQLASDIGMSRASLYKKTQQLLGITPNDYLRNVRLKHATELLEQGLPVNQVSLMVGFMTPRYFSQCFRKAFGVLPSEYRQGGTGASMEG